MTDSDESSRKLRDGREKEGKQDTPLWEWLVAGLSTLLVLGTIGFMLYQALSGSPSPPIITIQVDTIVDTGNGYVVEFHARNQGHATAAGLTIEGMLKSDTGTVEEGSVTIGYVPAQARRTGGLFFSNDPRKYELEIRAGGYERP